MTTDQHIDAIVEEFRKDPRNKVFVDSPALLVAVNEETGKKFTLQKLAQGLSRCSEGNPKSGDEAIYDGAVYVCHKVANLCFGDDAEAEVDIEVTFLNTESPRDLCAEIRPM